MLAGNVVAICFSGIVCVTLSLIKPQNYDWALMKEIPMIESDENAFANQVGLSRVPGHPGFVWGRNGVDGTCMQNHDCTVTQSTLVESGVYM